MYAIRESAQKINGVVVDTFERRSRNYRPHRW